MRPSGGVTAAAIVALLGSACVALFAFIWLLSLGFISHVNSEAGNLPKQGMTPATVGIVGGSLFNFAFAGWGLATGVGLFRLKPWARISILAYSGLLAAMAVFGLAFFLVVMPETPNTDDQALQQMFRIILGLFWLVLLSIAVWWLVFFTRKGVAAQFSRTSQTLASQQLQIEAVPMFVPIGQPRAQRPIFLTILAWYNVVSVPAGAPFLLLMRGFFTRIPIPIFGSLVTGRLVMIYLLISYALLLVSGIALLKDKVWGFWLAFGIQLFHLLNTGATFLLPGGVERFEKYVTAVDGVAVAGLTARASRPFDMRIFMTMALVGGALFSVVILCLLLSCRKRFYEFVAMQPQSRDAR